MSIFDPLYSLLGLVNSSSLSPTVTTAVDVKAQISESASSSGLESAPTPNAGIIAANTVPVTISSKTECSSIITSKNQTRETPTATTTQSVIIDHWIPRCQMLLSGSGFEGLNKHLIDQTGVYLAEQIRQKTGVEVLNSKFAPLAAHQWIEILCGIHSMMQETDEDTAEGKQSLDLNVKKKLEIGMPTLSADSLRGKMMINPQSCHSDPSLKSLSRLFMKDFQQLKTMELSEEISGTACNVYFSTKFQYMSVSIYTKTPLNATAAAQGVGLSDQLSTSSNANPWISYLLQPINIYAQLANLFASPMSIVANDSLANIEKAYGSLVSIISSQNFTPGDKQTEKKEKPQCLQAALSAASIQNIAIQSSQPTDISPDPFFLSLNSHFSPDSLFSVLKKYKKEFRTSEMHDSVQSSLELLPTVELKSHVFSKYMQSIEDDHLDFKTQSRVECGSFQAVRVGLPRKVLTAPPLVCEMRKGRGHAHPYQTASINLDVPRDTSSVMRESKTSSAHAQLFQPEAKKFADSPFLRQIRQQKLRLKTAKSQVVNVNAQPDASTIPVTVSTMNQLAKEAMAEFAKRNQRRRSDPASSNHSPTIINGGRTKARI